MAPDVISLRDRHRRQLDVLRRRGVKQVLLIVCDTPNPECRTVARRVWPADNAPDIPTHSCSWNSDPSDDRWDGCEYVPYVAALWAAHGPGDEG